MTARYQPRAEARQAALVEAGLAISEALAAAYGIPAQAPRRENLTGEPPRRKRRGALSDRQAKALHAIRQRPRTTRELAALLDVDLEAADKTALSLVRRRQVDLDRRLDVPAWVALTEKGT